MNNIFSYKEQKSNNLEPLLEIYKGKLYSYLVKIFINDCVETLGTNIFSIKKSFSRTITNILSSWIFSLYIDYDFSGDYFFPSNYDNVKLLDTILTDLCKYDNNIINPKDKINSILTKLKNNYQSHLTLYENYRTSNYFKNNKDKYNIDKSDIIINGNKFVKFNINLTFKIKDIKLLNILKNIIIPINIYDKMSNRYTGMKNKMDCYIWAIIFRYQLLSSNNHQLAVLPKIMNQMNEDYNLNFECFCSAINCTFNSFCSIYYDLEQYFGSVGSFFNFKPIKGTYGFNPPYQKDVIEIGIKRLFSFLDDNSELTFIITIPIWDSDGKNMMKDKYNNDLKKQNIDYGDFEIIKDIKESKYFKAMRMIAKEEFTYIDHNFGLYKNKTIQNTYVIILSNISINLDKFNNYIFL